MKNYGIPVPGCIECEITTYTTRLILEDPHFEAACYTHREAQGAEAKLPDQCSACQGCCCRV